MEILASELWKCANNTLFVRADIFTKKQSRMQNKQVVKRRNSYNSSDVDLPFTFNNATLQKSILQQKSFFEPSLIKPPIWLLSFRQRAQSYLCLCCVFRWTLKQKCKIHTVLASKPIQLGCEIHSQEWIRKGTGWGHCRLQSELKTFSLFKTLHITSKSKGKITSV